MADHLVRDQEPVSGASCGFTKLQWSLVVAGALLPWLLAAVWARPAAAPATGWYLEDLPDAVEKSKRQGRDLLVVFTAEWCGPCRRLKHDLARNESLRRDLLVCVVDLDKQRSLSDLHGVQGIPDLRLFRQGEQVKHATGYGGSPADLARWVQDR